MTLHVIDRWQTASMQGFCERHSFWIMKMKKNKFHFQGSYQILEGNLFTKKTWNLQNVDPKLPKTVSSNCRNVSRFFEWLNLRSRQERATVLRECLGSWSCLLVAHPRHLNILLVHTPAELVPSGWGDDGIANFDEWKGWTFLDVLKSRGVHSSRIFFRIATSLLKPHPFGIFKHLFLSTWCFLFHICPDLARSKRNPSGPMRIRWSRDRGKPLKEIIPRKFRIQEFAGGFVDERIFMGEIGDVIFFFVEQALFFRGLYYIYPIQFFCSSGIWRDKSLLRFSWLFVLIS